MPDPGQAAPKSAAASELTDSPYAAFRLGITLALMTIGNCGMYAVAVMLPAAQTEFGVARADASLPYTLMMVGFGVGGVLMGKLADRFGVMLPLLIGAASLGLGYGAARGAQMFLLMLAFGIASRLISGVICDRIGGIRTLLLGSVLQGVALLLYLLFDSLWSLHVVSALFGLFQGDIVPAYAIIVREYFEPKEAGARVGTVLMCSLLGMALGGWMSGKVYDLTGSYQAAFVNGIVWNLINVSIAVFLMSRAMRVPRRAHA